MHNDNDDTKKPAVSTALILREQLLAAISVADTAARTLKSATARAVEALPELATYNAARAEVKRLHALHTSATAGATPAAQQEGAR